MAEQSSAAVEPKVMNRGMVVVGAILIQLCLGAIYAWSVFTPYLVSVQPKKDKATGQYIQQVVFVESAGVLVPKVLPIKSPVPAADQRLVTVKVKKAVDAPVPAGYPKNVDRSALVEVDVQVVVKGDFRDGDDPLKPTAAEISAARSGWLKAESQYVFSAGLAFFAIVMVLAGRMMPKVGPRKLAMAGGIVLGLGYILAGLTGGENFWTTFLFVGVIGGSGIGLGYVVPIAVGMRWFPDKKGLITGLAVAGFGFGATLWITLAGKLGPLGGGQLLKNIGVSTTFLIYGIAYLIIVLIGSTWMCFPPEGWKPAGWTPPAPKGGKPAAGMTDFTSGEMLRTSQYYMILLTFAFGASAGLMSIGLMNLFPSEALKAAGLSPEAANAAASLAMGVFFALFNGLGRIAWGTISDKIGPKRSIIVMMATQGVFVICFQWMAGATATLYLFAMLIGFNFGGNFALFPTITADTFGAKYIGQNYGWVFLAYAIGGIFGPILGGKLGDLGRFPMAFTICGVLCLIAAVIILLVKPAQKATA